MMTANEFNSIWEYLNKRESRKDRFAALLLTIDIFIFMLCGAFAFFGKVADYSNFTYVAYLFLFLGVLLGLGYLVAMLIEVIVIIRRTFSGKGLFTELQYDEGKSLYLANEHRLETLQSLLVFIQGKITRLAARRMSMLQLLTIFGGAWFINEKSSILFGEYLYHDIAEYVKTVASILIPSSVALSSGLMIGIFFSYVRSERYTEHAEVLKKAIDLKENRVNTRGVYKKKIITSIKNYRNKRI